MVLLSGLPPEVITEILSSVSPEDLVSVRRVCRWLHDCTQHNVQLCRNVYLNSFDTPPTMKLEWERELHDYLRLKSICASESQNKTSELPFVCRTVKRLLRHSSRIKPGDPDMLFKHRDFHNVDLLSEILNSRSNHNAFFCRSFLFDRIRAHDTPDAVLVRDPERNQMSAELHCLLGTVLLTYHPEDGRAVSAYPYAVSKVYDMREHTPNTLWGPFLADGSGGVDWEKLEAILILLRYNIRSKGLLKFPILNKYWNHTFLGSSPESYMPMIRDGRPLPSNPQPLDQQDPYGVSGTWMRLVSFLDYSDFFRFNFPFRDLVADDTPRPPFGPGEELRLIIMKVHVTRIAPPGENDHPNYPVVHFEGTSHSMDNPWDDNANSELRGTVRTTQDGHVHWTTFSLFDGQTRWRSESIQIGGHRSGRGVIGYWFETNYDPNGPCGPTAFWKLHERKTTESILGGPVEAFSYLLTHSITNGVNIVINLDEHFAHFGADDDHDDADGGDDEDDEEDSDYHDGSGASHGEDGEEGEEGEAEDEGDDDDDDEHGEGDDDDDDDDDDFEPGQDDSDMMSDEEAAHHLLQFAPFEILPVLGAEEEAAGGINQTPDVVDTGNEP